MHMELGESMLATYLSTALDGERIRTGHLVYSGRSASSKP